VTTEKRDFSPNPVASSLTQNSSISLTQALSTFILSLQVSGRSRQTINLYQRSIKPFISYLGDRPIVTVSPGDLRAFLAHLGTRVNAVTVGIRWRSIRAFFNWLYREGLIADSPVKRFQSPKTPKQFPYVLNDTQLQALIQFAKIHISTWHGYRNYTIVITFLDCGLRVSELRGLTVNNLDLAHNSLQVTGKGSRERRVYFGRRLARVLREWLSRRTLSLPGDALFCSRGGYPLHRHEIARIVKRLAASAGPPRRALLPSHSPIHLRNPVHPQRR
jgi:site-specific recombinase XerD